MQDLCKTPPTTLRKPMHSRTSSPAHSRSGIKPRAVRVAEFVLLTVVLGACKGSVVDAPPAVDASVSVQGAGLNGTVWYGNEGDSRFVKVNAPSTGTYIFSGEKDAAGGFVRIAKVSVKTPTGVMFIDVDSLGRIAAISDAVDGLVTLTYTSSTQAIVTAVSMAGAKRRSAIVSLSQPVPYSSPGSAPSAPPARPRAAPVSGYARVSCGGTPVWPNASPGGGLKDLTTGAVEPLLFRKTANVGEYEYAIPFAPGLAPPASYTQDVWAALGSLCNLSTVAKAAIVAAGLCADPALCPIVTAAGAIVGGICIAKSFVDLLAPISNLFVPGNYSMEANAWYGTTLGTWRLARVPFGTAPTIVLDFPASACPTGFMYYFTATTVQQDLFNTLQKDSIGSPGTPLLPFNTTSIDTNNGPWGSGIISGGAHNNLVGSDGGFNSLASAYVDATPGGCAICAYHHETSYYLELLVPATDQGSWALWLRQRTSGYDPWSFGRDGQRTNCSGTYPLVHDTETLLTVRTPTPYKQRTINGQQWQILVACNVVDGMGAIGVNSRPIFSTMNGSLEVFARKL